VPCLVPLEEEHRDIELHPRARASNTPISPIQGFRRRPSRSHNINGSESGRCRARRPGLSALKRAQQGRAPRRMPVSDGVIAFAYLPFELRPTLRRDRVASPIF